MSKHSIIEKKPCEACYFRGSPNFPNMLPWPVVQQLILRAHEAVVVSDRVFLLRGQFLCLYEAFHFCILLE